MIIYTYIHIFILSNLTDIWGGGEIFDFTKFEGYLQNKNFPVLMTELRG